MDVHLVDRYFLLELIALFLDVLLLLVPIARVAHDLMEQLLLLAQFLRQELPTIPVVKEVVGSSPLGS